MWGGGGGGGVDGAPRNFGNGKGIMVNHGISRDMFCRKIILNIAIPLKRLQKFRNISNTEVYPLLNF